MRPWSVVLAPAACAAVACSAEPAGPVTVVAYDYWVTDDRVDVSLRDLAAVRLYDLQGDVLVPLPADIVGDELRVADAPERYYVEHPGGWLVTGERELALRVVHLGRRDAVLATSPATLELSLTALAPWRTGDQLELYSRGAGLWRLAPVAGVAEDATELSTTIDFAAEQLPRVEGDRTWVAQLGPRDFGGRPYVAIARAAELPAIDLAAEPSSVAAAELATPPETTLDVDWRISEFDDLRLVDHPVVAQAFYDLGVAALPQPDDAPIDRQYGASADLALLRTTDAAGLDLAGAYGFGNPFPDDFQVLLTAIAWYPTQHRVVDTDAPTVLFDAIWVRTPALDDPARPRLAPPRDLRVDGDELTWAAPELGDVAYYEVDLYPLTSRDGATTADAPVRIEVRGATSLRLPDAVLAPGAGAFVARVAAVALDPESWASAQTDVILAP